MKPAQKTTAYKPNVNHPPMGVIFAFILFAALLGVGPPGLQAQVLVQPGITHQFTNADNCLCDGTPFLDTVLKATISSCDQTRSRVEAAAILSVSAINNDVSAFSTVYTCFYVPSAGKETVLNATVAAKIDWNGVLFGAGIVGAGAAVQVDLLLVDETAGVIKASTEVFKKGQDSGALKGISVGGTHVIGDRTVSLQGTVVRGHQHSIRLKVTCSAESGLIGLDVGSIFYDNVFGLNLSGDYHVRWTELSITIEQDINEKLDQLLQGQEMLKQGQALLLQGQQMLKQGQAEIKQSIADHAAENKAMLAEIKNLLLTPQGTRPGFPLKK